MSTISYSAASTSVRNDFAAAHNRFWNRLATPGAWWTGAERVAIAAEVRNAWSCTLCQARKQALTPAAVQGDHDNLDALPAVAVEVIHRVVTDQSRLSRTWFNEIISRGLTAEQYVELIGTIVAIVSIDSFCLGIGLPLNPLPKSQPGEPSQYRPASAEPNEAWVSMIPGEQATGAEADLYDGNTNVGFVIRAMSLVPDEVRTLNDLGSVHYLPSWKVRDPNESAGSLSRMQMELIAGRVAAIQECYY